MNTLIGEWFVRSVDGIVEFGSCHIMTFAIVYYNPIPPCRHTRRQLIDHDFNTALTRRYTLMPDKCNSHILNKLHKSIARDLL